MIADPNAVFFTARNLAAVNVPVQLWASEYGGDGVTPEGVAAVGNSLAAKHEYRVVPELLESHKRRPVFVDARRAFDKTGVGHYDGIGL